MAENTRSDYWRQYDALTQELEGISADSLTQDICTALQEKICLTA